MQTVESQTPDLNSGDAAITAFLGNIRKLDNGRRAALRRNVGNTLNEARNVAWFYGVGGLTEDNIGASFLVATLMSDNRAARIQTQMRGDFGKSLRALAAKSGEAGVERRFRSLLDAEFDSATGDGNLTHYLQQLVVRMFAASIPINWFKLLDDIRHWDSPTRYVQRSWAMSFYALAESSTQTPTTAPATTPDPENTESE